MSDPTQNEAQTRAVLEEMHQLAEAGETEGAIPIGTEEDMQDFLDGLLALSGGDKPDGDWCPNCEAYAEFKIIQPVARPDFGVANVVKGCPNCRHTTIHQTQWIPIDEVSEA